MLLSATEASKQQYYSRISKKLMDSSRNPKAYCSLLKAFLNNTKIPCIHPLFHNNKFISNFRDKTELFYNYFSQQCTLIANSRQITATLNMKTTKTHSSIPVIRFLLWKWYLSLRKEISKCSPGLQNVW